MSRTILVSFFLITTGANVGAQFEKDLPAYLNGADTLLFPYYDDVRMISVNHTEARERVVDYLEGTRPRALSWSSLVPPSPPDEYFFQHRNGKVIKKYNSLYSIETLTKRLTGITPSRPGKPGRIFAAVSHKRNNWPEFQAEGWWGPPQWNNGIYRIFNDNNLQHQTDFLRKRNLSAEPEILSGLIDSSGNIILPVNYSHLAPAGQNILAVKEKRFGIITPAGKPVVPMEFDNIQQIDQNRMSFFNDNKLTAIFHIREEKYYPLPGYDWSNLDLPDYSARRGKQSQKLFPVSKDGFYGLLDVQYREVLPLKYQYCLPHFSDRLARVCVNNKWGYIDTQCRVVITPVYEDAMDFENGKAGVWLNGNPLCIDTNGRETDCGNFIHDKRTTKGTGSEQNIVRRGPWYGLVDKAGRMILPAIYNSIRPYTLDGNHEGKPTEYYLISNHPFKGLVNDNGKQLLPVIYHSIGDFTGSEKKYALVEINNKFGLINRKFRLVIPCRYEGLIHMLLTGYIIFMEDGKYGWMDEEGKVIVHPRFDQVGHAAPGSLLVGLDKKWALVNSGGELLTTEWYDMIGSFTGSGMVKVRKGEYWGFIGTDGQVRIPLQYKDVSDMTGSVAGVSNGGLFALADTTGLLLTPFIYEKVFATLNGDGTIKVKRNGKFGFVNKNGTEVIPCEYDDVSGYNKNGHRVKRGSQWMYVKAED